MSTTVSRSRVFYRIHTEHLSDLESYVKAEFPSFSIVSGIGYWHGIPELSMCVEIIAAPDDRAQVLRLAATIKHTYNQEAVYVTETPVELHIV